MLCGCFYSSLVIFDLDLSPVPFLTGDSEGLLTAKARMPAYIYKATTLEGKVIEGTMEASDNGSVAIKLQDMGLLPIKVGLAEKKNALTRELDFPWKRKKVRRKDLLVFTQELHTLVKSGFPSIRRHHPEDASPLFQV